MKTPHLIAVLFWVSSTVAVGQKQQFHDLTPVTGIYKTLNEYSPHPDSKNAEMDTITFPYSAASVERLEQYKPHYLVDVTLSDFQIPDPPANSSERTRLELNYLLRLQQQRTALDVESGLYMAGVFYNIKTTPDDPNYSSYRRNLFHIGRSIGTWFNPEDLPVTADFMARVWRDASYFIWASKYKYLRARPYVLDPDIDNLEETNWAAYPSGHATNSYVNAFVYQELAPEFSEVFIRDAFDMAHSREVIGVHYPSDSEAGRILSRQIVNKLFQNEKFLSDLALVRKEWSEKSRETFTKPKVKVETNKPASSCPPKSTTSACAQTCTTNGSM